MERRFLDEHGWVVLRAAAGEAERAELERAFDQVLPPLLYPHAQKGQVWQVLGAARQHPVVGAWLRSVGARVAALFGAARLRLLQDTFLCKPPRVGGVVEWHQDYTYTGYLEPARSLSIRLALTDCTLESGCLEVIDGSHLWAWRGRPSILERDRVDDALDQLPRELRARVESCRRPVELRAGDASIHHCLTLHASLPNRSAQARKTIIAHVFDDDCRLVRERLPPGAEQHFAADADGRLDEAAFPTLFSGG